MSHPLPSKKVFWYEGFSYTPKKCIADATYDIAIVGGGIAGLMCAQKLVETNASLKVCIVEASWCGGGASGKSSGFITPDSELEFSNLVDDFGIETAQKLWNFAKGGVAAIQKTIESHPIVCDYQVQNSLFIARSKSAFTKKVVPEHASQIEAGYTCTLHDIESLKTVIGSASYHGAVEYKDTFGINSFKFCQGLKNILENNGVAIFEDSPVVSIEKNTVVLKESKITAKNIVVATDRFLPDLGIVTNEMYCAQTFLSISKPLNDEKIKKIFPSGAKMVWDTDLIYQYYRLTGDNRLLLGAASVLYTYLGKEKIPPQKIINKMYSYLETVFPDCEIEMDYIWPGLIGVSKDFVPIAGSHPDIPNVWFLGGAAGLPWATALGIYAANKITGVQQDDLDTYFSPERHFPVGTNMQSILSKPVSFAISHGIRKSFS